MWSERPHLRDHIVGRDLLAGSPVDRDDDPLSDESVKRDISDGFAAWDEMRGGVDMRTSVGKERRMGDAQVVSLDRAQLPYLGRGVPGTMEHSVRYGLAQIDEPARHHDVVVAAKSLLHRRRGDNGENDSR